MAEPRHDGANRGGRAPEIEAMAARGLTAGQITRLLGVSVSYATKVVQEYRHSTRKPEEGLGPDLAEQCERHAEVCLAFGGFPAALRVGKHTVHVYPAAA